MAQPIISYFLKSFFSLSQYLHHESLSFFFLFTVLFAINIFPCEVVCFAHLFFRESITYIPTYYFLRGSITYRSVTYLPTLPSWWCFFVLFNLPWEWIPSLCGEDIFIYSWKCIDYIFLFPLQLYSCIRRKNWIV